MHFGQTLKNSIYEPWRSNYIDYAALKSLLREDQTKGKEEEKWTDEDEGRFVEELVNVQLEKVNAFQATTHQSLRERTSACEEKLNGIKATKDEGTDEHSAEQDKAHREAVLKEVLEELDKITMEVNELEKYSRLNFTGFLKAAKKHDRQRGSKYRVRPLLQVRLASLPFNSEDYSPLLYRLSAMYSFVRQGLHDESGKTELRDNMTDGDTYKSYKFWVHPENILEVKTYILRHLPVLIYNPQTSQVTESRPPDPSITSLYFDNPQFSLYNDKVDKTAGASSLRLRWFGHLSSKPEIFLEKKTVNEDGTSEEIRLSLKEKYVGPVIIGESKLEKTVEKLRERQGSDDDVARLQQNIEEIQGFVKDNNLQPMLRANYTRTAFQIPGDDRVRISLDTNLAFLREDSLESDAPCRDSEDWHRKDIDDADMEYPFTDLRQGELSKFPFGVLEIKVRDGVNKRIKDWVSELRSSHLVKEAPRFSKFIHGVATLFEDYVNTFPFWLGELDTDIRKDPELAFQWEQEKKAEQAKMEELAASFKSGKSPAGPQKAKSAAKPTSKSPLAAKLPLKYDSEQDDNSANQSSSGVVSGMRLLLPSFSSSKYARAHRQSRVQLPPGVTQPRQLIKDKGPVQVEPKVWLANQRTFIKWQHISVLLATLSLGLYNAAGESNNVARSLAVAYTLVALFAGAWGWWQYIVRSRMIEQRSGKHFDNIIGPAIVCIGLIIALCLNFGFQYHNASQNRAPANIYEYYGMEMGIESPSVKLPDLDLGLDVDEVRQDLR